ncbi:MAG TPA: DUF1579 family protein [Candidatus Acidoferrum sp.]|nr:DUF1579 family protein [Candidatus Acidoferrum sp.]
MKCTFVSICRCLLILLVLPLVFFPSGLPGAQAQQTVAGAVLGEMKLKPEVESLAGFEGKWACKGVFPSNGKSIESQIVFTRDLEGAWLAIRHDDLPPNLFHAAEYWGFDPAAKQFVAFVYDNFGGVRRFTSSGWADNTLVWLGETSKTDPPAVQRFVYKRDNPNQFVVNWEVKRGTDDWQIGDTLTCKK